MRYAVVGLGDISQAAVLPAFANTSNSELRAILSHDEVKLKKLSRKYGVPIRGGYDDFDFLMKSGEIDAVYIALPNHLHAEYAIRAARAGIHVFCEKPMGITVRECEKMSAAARRAGVKLMVGYRLHFEEANLEAIETARSGKLGKLRFFNSTFSYVAEKGNIRLRPETAGGALFDIGIYCINAARSLFSSEPEAVSAMIHRSGGVDMGVAATLRFSDNRLASFNIAFDAAETSSYVIAGDRGTLRLDNAYEYAEPMNSTLAIGPRTSRRYYEKRDQFAAELIYFSCCVIENKEPEPSGEEGLADLRVIEALFRSERTGRTISLKPFGRRAHPSKRQLITRPILRQVA